MTGGFELAEEIYTPKVSIVITAGNSLKVCVESVLAQTFTDFEILIVGDRPAFELNDPRIKFVATENFLNANGKRNVGIERARGDYIYFLDGEGMIFDNALEILLNAAAESNAEIIQSTNFVEREGEDVKIISNQKLLPLNLYRKNFIENARLKFPESSADAAPFCYAAECLAPTMAILDDYFYVVDRQKKIRAESAEYVKDIYRDEIRCGFLVTTQRKKLWNAQIKLILEFARICQKYNLKWFAYAGTLIGAVRHKGFIPWDDDVDLGMLRPDYETFKKVAPLELKPNFSFDAPYNYAVEGEPNEEGLPMITLETIREIRARGWTWPVISDFIKVRDDSTAMIQWVDRRNVNQGIWIDIFPFDPVPPFDDEKKYIDLEIKKELMMAASYPDVIQKALESGEEPVIPKDTLKDILKLPFKQRALLLQERLATHYFESPNIGRMGNYFLHEKVYTWKSAFVRDFVQLPFEEITLPAPIDYEGFLTARHKNWREYVIKKSHVSSSTADIPYKTFFKLVSPAIKEMNF